MKRDPLLVGAAETLDAALPQLEYEKGSALVVDDRGRLIGLLTLANVGELVLLRGGSRTAK